MTRGGRVGRRLALPVAVILTMALGCSNDEGDGGGVEPVVDTTAPAAITDLAVAEVRNCGARLSWTAPGDDGNEGTADAYDCRYARSPITSDTWLSATQVPNEPEPFAAGTPDGLTVSGLTVGATYFFAVRTRDERGNWSDLSNVASDSIPALPQIALRLIPAGTFTMGSPDTEPGHQFIEEPEHTVTLTEPFYISATEITQAQWEAIMCASPGQFDGCEDCPVERVSWFDAIDFCNRLSIREGLERAYRRVEDVVTWNRDAPGYRLPTEAEWEYACRAGSGTAFANGDITDTLCIPLDPVLDAIGWYCGNAAGQTHPAGAKTANAFELHDMHGSVWEWCWDWYGEDYYATSLPEDPTGPEVGNLRVARGGSWRHVAASCRSAKRSAFDPRVESEVVGLRVVRGAPAP